MDRHYNLSIFNLLNINTMFEKRVTPGKSYCVTAYSPVVITASLNNKEVTLVDATKAGQYFFVAPTTIVVSSISPNYIIEVKGGTGVGGSGSSSGVGISFEKVDDFNSLPAVGQLGTIYLVPNEDTDNQWTEYVYIDGRYEIIGSKEFTMPDMSQYAKLDIDNEFTGNNTFTSDVEVSGFPGQPYFFDTPSEMLCDVVYDLGLLTENKDLSGIHFANISTHVQTCEIWFKTSETVYTVTWPSDSIWPDEIGGIAPTALQSNTAYRYAVRREVNGTFVIAKAYSYPV